MTKFEVGRLSVGWQLAVVTEILKIDRMNLKFSELIAVLVGSDEILSLILKMFTVYYFDNIILDIVLANFDQILKENELNA